MFKNLRSLFIVFSLAAMLLGGTLTPSTTFARGQAEGSTDSRFPLLNADLNLLDLVEACSNPPEGAVGLNRAKTWLAGQLPEDLSSEDQNILVAGLYLQAQDMLAKNIGNLSLDKVYSAFTQPIDEDQLQQFDRNYFTQVLENTKSRMAKDPELAASVKDISNNLMAKGKRKCNCMINGKSVACWKCIVIIIIIIIIVIVLL